MADPLLRLKVSFDGTPVIRYEKKKLKALMRQAGNEVAAAARALIRRSVGGGRTYRGSGGSKYRPYKPGPYTASAPRQPPVSVTGTLLGSIIVRPFKSGEGVAVRERAFYALFLAKGAKGGGRFKGTKGRAGGGTRTQRVLEPRPSLTTVLEQRQASLGSRIRAAVLDDIKFKRQRA